MNRIPELSIDLVKELDKLYPARHPDISETDRQIWFNAGARAVVELLLQRSKNVKRRQVFNNDDNLDEDEE